MIADCIRYVDWSIDHWLFWSLGDFSPSFCYFGSIATIARCVLFCNPKLLQGPSCNPKFLQTKLQTEILICRPKDFHGRRNPLLQAEKLPRLHIKTHQGATHYESLVFGVVSRCWLDVPTFSMLWELGDIRSVLMSLASMLVLLLLSLCQWKPDKSRAHNLLEHDLALDNTVAFIRHNLVNYRVIWWGNECSY